MRQDDLQKVLRYPATQGHQLQEEKVRTQWRSQTQEEDKGLIEAAVCFIIFVDKTALVYLISFS